MEVTSGPGDAQKLVIAKAEKADEGVYTLEAKNPVSVAKSGPSQVTVVRKLIQDIHDVKTLHSVFTTVDA